MTHKELKENGWVPVECRIGTLYFSEGGFFCSFCDENKVKVYHSSDDIHPLGFADTLDEIKDIQMKFDQDEFTSLENKLYLLKTLFKKNYGKNPVEHMDGGVVLSTLSFRVGDIINPEGEDLALFVKLPRTVDLEFNKDDKIKLKIIKAEK